MSDADLRALLLTDFEGHLDRYSDTDTFPCLFCGEETADPVSILLHLAISHNFAISNIRALSLLPNYLQHWRIHPAPIIDCALYSRPMQTIDPAHPDEIKHRSILHKIRLDRVVSESEHERTHSERGLRCLFCEETFSGTWHDYLQWLFEKHSFNPGRPSNLVFIPELIALLRATLDANTCINCGEDFQTQKQLRSHMKKKPHTKIPDRRVFDRYYMVNYLEAGQTWRDIVAEGDGIEDEGSLEDGLKDFENDDVWEETQCLICEMVASTPGDCVAHMDTIHGFKFTDVIEGVGSGFYELVRFVNWARARKKEGMCFICGTRLVGEQYADHIERHDRKCPVVRREDLAGEEFLIPVIEGDPLLTVLEDAQTLS
jgi:uncharacterized C2H2 Zn-finger protein